MLSETILILTFAQEIEKNWNIFLQKLSYTTFDFTAVGLSALIKLHTEGEADV